MKAEIMLIPVSETREKFSIFANNDMKILSLLISHLTQ